MARVAVQLVQCEEREHEALKADLVRFCSELRIIGEQRLSGVSGKLLLGNCRCNTTLAYPLGGWTDED